MARPRDPQKATTILTQAVEVVAQQGVTASTSTIARKAGVAEGTLFRYFPTKDDLLNALYVHLAGEARAHITSRPGQGARQNLRQAWDDYIAWGLGNLHASSAMRQIAASNRLTDSTRQTVDNLFPEFITLGATREGQKPSADEAAFFDAAFMALADIVISHQHANPGNTTWRDKAFTMLLAVLPGPA
ncbi:TetR/AcrR family transcriptional regulator [Formicincola oecophyllae]|uniref:TetR/AcrR family transcriptional regulator n=1 Tax=Formicincola oecophyllae TaxID=2558361 RepID=A0A4Y6U8L3_9PROT|nr:TetR/AcrR family transcriptional regulator [Formicincola oecophyllae]QDH13330.1 TetR/AcrR family transcriptional regulator [Formicincola oecophyllae]